MRSETALPFDTAQPDFIEYLKHKRDQINHHDMDFCLVISGGERKGKSTLAARIGDFMSYGKMTVDQICIDIDEFLTSLHNSNKGDVIIFDEAGTNLYSRESMTTMNRILTKAFMVSGLKNVCMIFNIPNFFNLDNYIRTHRVNMLIQIPKRGKFRYYSAKRAKEISLKGAKEKKIEVVRSNGVGWFTKQFPERLEKEYRLKERKFKMGYIKNIKRDIEGNYSFLKFMEVTGYSENTVMKWIKTKYLKARKIGGRWFIPKGEAERIIMEKHKNDSYVPNETFE